MPAHHQFWSLSADELLANLSSTREGLSEQEARRRLKEVGPNLLKPKRKTGTIFLLLSQFKSPIILILLFASGLSFYLGDTTNAAIIIGIVMISGLLSFWQEQGAHNAVQKLLAMVRIKVTVQREGKAREFPTEEVVPGDILLLSAGAIIPADSLLLESSNLFVDEAALTGETYPVEKEVGVLPAETALSKRTNSVFMGTHVISGKATALVCATARQTVFGSIYERLKLKPQETEFEHGVRHFGYLLMEVTLILVITIFAINVLLSRPVLESFLFTLALAVGLTPQLLPAIISINLAQGAKQMAQKKVVVKRLASIENFGSMNILCADKTGTLTEGLVKLHSAVDITGKNSERVLLYSYINAFYESGFANPIDTALRDYRQLDMTEYQKLDEIPYDFIRKLLSILVTTPKENLLVTKGAFANVLSVCSRAEISPDKMVDISQVQAQIVQRFEQFSQDGYRVLGLAYKNMGKNTRITKEQEKEMTFLGLLVFFDPPKPEVRETIALMKRLGVSLKVITGDNRLVAQKVSQEVGLPHHKIITGTELRHISDSALPRRVNNVDVFAEIEPNQKERIILALRRAGNVVGYMGDGINDVSALHSADVGISVESAVAVAKEAAEIILLEKGLEVLVSGIREGRKTFANTLKYVFMATSANFGNMFSMAGASLFMPFLPLLPGQILLTNLLTDFPEMTIATDSVDQEMVDQPHRWNIKFIRKFMVVFGILSSVFDYLTFGVLLFFLKANTAQFRTGWFLESVISASLIVLVIRSRRSIYQSKPGKYLLTTTLIIFAVTIALPFTPLGALFGFQSLPISFLLILLGIVLLYALSAELAKRIFYRRVMM